MLLFIVDLATLGIMLFPLIFHIFQYILSTINEINNNKKIFWFIISYYYCSRSCLESQFNSKNNKSIKKVIILFTLVENTAALMIEIIIGIIILKLLKVNKTSMTVIIIVLMTILQCGKMKKR